MKKNYRDGEGYEEGYKNEGYDEGDGDGYRDEGDGDGVVIVDGSKVLLTTPGAVFLV